MGMLAIAFSSEESRRIGAGLLGAVPDSVAGSIALAAAVVGGANDHGAVDVAVLKGNHDLLAGTRYEVAAPIPAGNGNHDAQPDAQS